jgi:hypothetical protein
MAHERTRDFGANSKRSAKLINAPSTESFRFGNFSSCRFAVFEIFRVTILRFPIFADCLSTPGERPGHVPGR